MNRRIICVVMFLFFMFLLAGCQHSEGKEPGVLDLPKEQESTAEIKESEPERESDPVPDEKSGTSEVLEQDDRNNIDSAEEDEDFPAENQNAVEDSAGDQNLKCVEGYVVDVQNNGSIIMVDLVDPEPTMGNMQERLDRATAFDIEKARIDIVRNELEEQLGMSTKIRSCIPVYMEYYEENGENIVTYLKTNALEGTSPSDFLD